MKSIHQTNFYQCEETDLPYNMHHCNKTPADTQKENQTKFKYPAETTARSRENSPPDVSVYQTSSDNK